MTAHALVKLMVEELVHTERTEKEYYAHTDKSGKENKETNNFVMFWVLFVCLMTDSNKKTNKQEKKLCLSVWLGCFFSIILNLISLLVRNIT